MDENGPAAVLKTYYFYFHPVLHNILTC